MKSFLYYNYSLSWDRIITIYNLFYDIHDSAICKQLIYKFRALHIIKKFLDNL